MDRPRDPLGRLGAPVGTRREGRLRVVVGEDGQHQGTLVDGEGDGRRRRHGVGPVGPRHADAQHLPRGPEVGAGVQDDLDGVDHARFERDRRAVDAVTERQVEGAPGHEGGGAVREDVADLHRERGGRPVDAQLQPRSRVPDHGRLGRGEVPRQRAGVVEALVAGQPPGEVPGAVDPRGRAGVGGDRRRPRAGQHPLVGRGGRHRRQAQPVPLVQVEVRLRAGGRADEDVAAVGVRPAAAQPVVEPPGELGVEVEPRSRHRGRGVGVRPRAGEQPVRGALRGEPGHRPEGAVAVAVGPAGHQHRRHLDPLVAGVVGVEADRAVRPVGAVPRLAQPGEHPGFVRLEPASPLGLPALAPDGRHRRQHVHRRHVVVVVDLVDQPERAAAPVHVVGPPVVGGVDRADRLERRRPLAGHLEGVEAGVRRAPHAHLAVAPVLGRQPGDHLGEVALLGRLVLVERVAARRAGATQVEAAHGVPVLVAQPLVGGGVGRREVVLPVGQRLEEARLRRLGVGQVQRRGQRDPVRHRDPHLGRRRSHERIVAGPSCGWMVA